MTDPDRIASLSRRERECLRLVYERRTTKEIALALDLSPGTVFGYISTAQGKLGARDRRQAAEWLQAAETPPIGSKEQGDWVASTGAPVPTDWPERWRRWRGQLPIRQNGARTNDLSIFARAIWPFVIAAIFATGFGMLAVGADVLSTLYRRWVGQ